MNFVPSYFGQLEALVMLNFIESTELWKTQMQPKIQNT